MRPPGKKPSLDAEGGSVLSMKAWILIIFGILFILYAITPPLRGAVNSALGDFLAPLVQLGQNSMEMLNNFG
jgi:hypothetical protein